MPRSLAEVQTPGRKLRSELKRGAILDAAEALFVAQGYASTSVDAIAARAGVSKRTLYDHFGDKATIYARTVERLSDTLLTTISDAIREEIPPGRDVREALVGFARRVVTETVPSSEYAVFQRLTARQAQPPALPSSVRNRPERLLEKRFAELTRDGLFQATDASLAVRHFTALTIGIAIDALEDGEFEVAGDAGTDKIIDDGVDAFLRAYA
ncbi:transcriptional regulator [Sinosporangium siamense]|uniref:Transcriptional regulator n=1 Tax=Sinosporangium siamense TaxID=1367973 RepID=A0A919RQU9_9ACTN|nr:transcriptional regulator [Sinosporangium siamense]